MFALVLLPPEPRVAVILALRQIVVRQTRADLHFWRAPQRAQTRRRRRRVVSVGGSDATTPLFSASYTVRVHEHVDAEFAKVTLKCIGYPTHGVQPAEWEFVLRVPKADLDKWPLGASVRLAVK